jgi:glycosyltransferase involved in cell wall biosynthesis
MSNTVRSGVCLIPLTTIVSGTERIVLDIAEELTRRNVPVTALLPAGNRQDQYEQTWKRLEPNVYHLGKIHGRRNPLKNAFDTWRYLQKVRPEFVHFHCPNYRWGLEVIAAAMLSGVPTVIRTEHNPLMWAPPSLMSKLLRLLDTKVKTFTYVSSGNAKRFEKHLPHRIGRGVVINNSIDPVAYAPSASPEARRRIREQFGFPEDSLVAIYVGSFGDRRPLGPIFEAFKLLLKRPETAELAQKWRLLIVGHGPETEVVNPETEPIAKYIHLAGRRKDVGDILPQCDLFVSASHYEGQSIAMLEAWSSGLPLLTMDVDGLEDVLGAEVARTQVVAGRDDSAAFADAWAAFMIDPEARRAAQAPAIEYVRTQLTQEHMLSAFMKVYGK